MVCVDNSEFTRNGDYGPTRFQAQADAVNLLAGAKTQHHPENTVGVLTMAGKTPQVTTLHERHDDQSPPSLTTTVPLPLAHSRFWSRPPPTWAGCSTQCRR